MVMTTLTYTEALSEVKARVAASRTSFYAGMAVLPKARRDAMYALYGFCREVDDIADDSLTPEIAAKGLEQWRGHIADVFRGKATNAITTALLPAISQFNLDEKEFHEIIDGMEMDSGAVAVATPLEGGAEQSRQHIRYAIVAPNYKTLDTYCDLVASAVGRVSVRIFGDASADAMQVAHHLGRALQLTNILRDLGEDAARGRLYLPLELLDKHHVSSRVPKEVLRSPHLSAICRDLADQAREHYRFADQYMAKCVPAAMRPARIMRSYYGAIFDRLAMLDWRDPFTRVSLSKFQKIALMIKGTFA